MGVLAILLFGCAPAWRPGVPGRLDLEPPPGWAVTRNYRAFGSDTLVLSHGGASINVTTRPDRGRAQRLPLDLVAGVRALSWGRRLGIESSVLAEHDILLDGRRACAVTGERRWRNVSVGYTMVVTRTPGRIAELVLHAPRGALDAEVADWAVFLDHFHLAAPVEPDGPLFEDDAWRR